MELQRNGKLRLKDPHSVTPSPRIIQQLGHLSELGLGFANNTVSPLMGLLCKLKNNMFTQRSFKEKHVHTTQLLGNTAAYRMK